MGILPPISPTCFSLVQTHHYIPKVNHIYKDNLKSTVRGTLLSTSSAITPLNRTHQNWYLNSMQRISNYRSDSNAKDDLRDLQIEISLDFPA